MNTQLNPKRLLLEVLLVVAVAEISVMLLLPVLAPGLGTLAEGLLDVTLLLLLSAPAAYWRVMRALRHEPRAATPQPTGRKDFAIILTAIAQALGLLLTTGCIWWQSNNLDQADRLRFTLAAQRTEAEVTRRLNQSVDGLRGARGALAANPRLGRQQFRDYVASRDLAAEFPGISGFGYVERVPRPALARFVARERADGAPDFAVQSQGQASDLWVVKYMEPLANNRAAWGYDLGQTADSREALEYAMSTGQPTLLAQPHLLQDAAHQPGFLFMLPVYRGIATPATTQLRQRELVGLLYAPIVARELLGTIASAANEQIDFELFDGAQADPAQLIYDADGQHSASGAGAELTRAFSSLQLINVGSRVLALRCSSRPDFAALQDRSSLALIGLGGTLLSLLMALSVWQLARGRQRAQDLADAMTAELDRMAQVVQHTDNAVTIMDREMRIQWANQGFVRITGYALEDALGHTPGALLSSGKSDPAAIAQLIDGARNGEACRVQLINRTRDGREYWADTEVQPMLDRNGVLVGFMEIGTDISPQKRTQHQLEAAMRDARALLDTLELHAIVSSTDPLGNITEVNDAFCRVSGYAREELIGQNHRLLKSGVQPDAFWIDLWTTIGSGKPWRGVICNRTRDGSLYWVDSMIAPFVGEDGRIEKYVSIRTDITQQQLSAERLRQSEATFVASFQNAATGMAFLSPKGLWLKVNPAMCEFLGWTEEDLQSMTFMDTSHPEEWDTDMEQMQRLLGGEIHVYQRAKRYVHRDGSLIWGLASISVVRADNGTPDFVLTQIVDITARKRAEEALSLSSALMEASQAVAKVGGWELDLVSGHLYWTRETYRIHETTQDEFNPTVDASIEFYLPGSRERISAAVQAAIETGQGYDLELETLTCTGRRIDVRTTGAATMEHGKVVRLSGIFQDITERKEYERSLKDARARAEQATQSKGQFLANMSHEIRTPMNAILGMLKLLHNTELSPRQRDYADKTEGAAKSLLGLINDILDFSKVEAGKMALDPQPFRIDRLMRNLSVILSSNLGAKPVEVLFDIDPKLPDVLLGDALRLQQVLINLGGNAVKFTAQGQVVVSVRLLQVADGTAQLEFAVQDSGIGIAPEHQGHIFTGFSQAEPSTTRKFGGTGLGLAISRRLVDLMGGELTLSSSLGAGSRFGFCLQLPVVSDVPQDLQMPARAPVEFRRVLVVDSNPFARDLLSRMAQSWGWPTEAVDSGEAALQLIGSRMQSGSFPFDVVYMDWHMTGMDGWTATARLRQLCTEALARQPVVVMVSSNSREALDQRTQAEQALLNGFLMKPVTASMLLEAALESSQSPARIRQSTRSAAGQRRLTGMRILVVEDNLINQQVAEELLMHEGALVSLAANGQLGVDAIAAADSAGQQFHAVLMDIQMPVLDGFAATRVVREQLQLTTLPIIAMTANAMASDREECLAAGMNEHVGKPFDLKVLVQTLIEVTGFAVSQPERRSAARKPAPRPTLPTATGTLDVASALARMGGLTKLYRRSAQDFIRTLPEQLASLRGLAAVGSPECARLAHTLKGTAALLGASALAACAAELEALCRDPQAQASRMALLTPMQVLMDDSARQLQQALAAMPEPAGEAPAAAPHAAAPSALADALARLMPLLVAADLSALEQFASDRATWVSAPEALLRPLEEALQDLELEAALAACQALQQWLQENL